MKNAPLELEGGTFFAF